MLPGTLPDEMPGMLRIDPDRAAPVSISRTKVTSKSLLEVCLMICCSELVFAKLRWHEANSKNTAVRRITKSVHLPLLVAAVLKRSAQSCIGERISNIWRSNIHGDLK